MGKKISKDDKINRRFKISLIIFIIVPIITTIDVSDDKLNMGKDYTMIISKDQKEMTKQVKEILKKTPKVNKIDIEKLQSTRMDDFEKLFDGVI